MTSENTFPFKFYGKVFLLVYICSNKINIYIIN